MNTCKYTEGLDMTRFKVIKESNDHHNRYYIGFDNDLLYAESNDDGFTNWWVVTNKSFHHIGTSFFDSYDGDQLIK